MDWLALGYLALATVVVTASALITTQTWEHRRFARSRARHPNSTPPRGRIALFVPCKGADADLESNLRPLFEQDYDDYELVFAVESADDAACQPIQRLMSEYPGLRSKCVVAGSATVSGQKIHNLLAATARLSDEVRILAFADADVRPPRDWLRLLTQRLDHHAAATGYRWFVPERPTLASCLLSSIESSAATIMFPGIHHLVWGGSWAICRDVFEGCHIREAWQGTLSDDLVASQVLAKWDYRVALEPACILPSPADINLRTAMSFMRRQFTIGRYYSPVFWRISTFWTCLSQAFFWGSLMAALGAWQAGSSWAWQPATVTLTLYAIHLFRAWIRQRATRYYLPTRQDELRVARWFDIWLGPVAALVACAGLISSAFGNSIVWKGITYELASGGRVRSITFPGQRRRELGGEKQSVPFDQQRAA